MGYYRRARIVVSVLFFFLTTFLYANTKDLYNSLVEDLLNACSYGYKGTCLETGEVDFANYTGENGYIITTNESNFYIQSEKVFSR